MKTGESELNNTDTREAEYNPRGFCPALLLTTAGDDDDDDDDPME